MTCARNFSGIRSASTIAHDEQQAGRRIWLPFADSVTIFVERAHGARVTAGAIS